MKLSIVCYIASILCTLVSAAPPVNAKARDGPVQPTDDPFYTPPSGYENQPLGTILRFREKTNAYGIIVFQEHVKHVYQVLVRSEDTFHQPLAIMTTLFVPYNADPTKLLSYQTAEDSAYINCAISYAMQLWSDPTTYITSQIEQLNIIGGLQQGWYVVVPDHEGPKSTYVAGWLAGYAVLNSVKAILSTGNQTGIDPNAEVTFWGYSGGSLGSGWGAQLQPTYYPELNLIGAAYGGIIVNVTSVASNNMGSLFAGLVISAINGLSNEYPTLKEFISTAVIPEKLSTFTNAEHLCLIEYVPYYAFDEWTDYIPEGEAVLNNPIVKNVTDQNNMITNGLIPKCPLMWYSSANDEILPIADTDALYQHFCSNGVSVTFHRDELSEHITQAIVGAGEALNWLIGRYNGTSAPEQCVLTQSISNLLLPGSIAGLEKTGSAALAAAMGVNIGPSS